MVSEENGRSRVKAQAPGKTSTAPARIAFSRHLNIYVLFTSQHSNSLLNQQFRVAVNGQALFGPYRHVLERRGEALLDAALSLWEPYLTSILAALDGMPAEAEVDLTLLVRATTPHTLTTPPVFVPEQNTNDTVASANDK